MSPTRYLPKRDYLGLKAATRRLIESVGGGGEGERISRVSQQGLDRYGSIHADHVERFAAIDVVADLEAACGEPVVTRKLAELSGHVLVALPKGSLSGSKLDVITGKVVKEVGEVMVALGEARMDGTITHEERQNLRSEIRDALIMLIDLDRQIGIEAEPAQEKGAEH